MLTDKIFKIVQNKHTITGGHCGVYLTSILIDLKYSKDQIEEVIENLHNENKIELRKGINGLMVKLLQ